jgi:hypothetical protein
LLESSTKSKEEEELAVVVVEFPFPGNFKVGASITDAKLNMFHVLKFTLSHVVRETNDKYIVEISLSVEVVVGVVVEAD